MPIRKGDGTGISSVRLGDGTEIIEIRKGDGTVLFRAGTPASSLSHHWPTDEGSGTTLTDNQGSVDATINDGTWTDRGRGGYHLKFTDNTSNAVTATDSGFGNSDYTFMGWMRPDRDDISGGNDAFGGDQQPSRSYMVSYNRSGNEDITLFLDSANGGSNIEVESGERHQVGQWIFVAFTLDVTANEATLYWATADESTLSSKTNTTYDDGGSQIANITASRMGRETGDYFEGGCDDWHVGPGTVLSQSQIESYFNDTKINYTFQKFPFYSFTNGYDTSTEDSRITGLTFKDDGTRMWTSAPDAGTGTNAKIYAYDLSTAWDTSTASLAHSLDVNSEHDQPQTPGFNDDGTKLYVPQLDSNIYEYNLSTAYDVTSASLNQSFTVTKDSETHPLTAEWSDNGTTCIVGAGTNDQVFEYTASTAFDISTLSFNQKFQPTELGSDLKTSTIVDGNQMLLASFGFDYIYRYELGSDYSLSTIEFVGALDVSGQTNSVKGADAKDDLSVVYGTDDQNVRVLEYR